MGRPIESRIGEIVSTDLYGDVEIIEYFKNINCTVKFLEDSTILYNIQYRNIKTKLKNPNKPKFFGLGFFGIGKYDAKEYNMYYDKWRHMFDRCYNEKIQKLKPTYVGCSVDEQWHNFQNFAAWMDENYKPSLMLWWEIDKDILISGNKIYSPETCCLVPSEINNLFRMPFLGDNGLPRGVSKKGSKFCSRIFFENERIYLGTFDTIDEASSYYERVRKEKIKTLADKHKDTLNPKVYKALIDKTIKT